MTTLAERVAAIPWYHSIDLGSGLVTPGSLELVLPGWQQRISDAIPQDLTGKSVLDIGAWDGYYSFLAERRNAKHVLAIDSLGFSKEPRYQQDHNGFKLAKEALHSSVEYAVIPVEDIDRIVGDFDVVFFFGVYYHVSDPIRVFERVCKKVRELLVVEGDALDFPSLMLVRNFADPDQFSTWRYTRSLLHLTLSEQGFSSVSEVSFVPISTVRPPGFDKHITAGRSLIRCWR